MKFILKILYGIDIVGFIYFVMRVINTLTDLQMDKTTFGYLLLFSIPIGLFAYNIVDTTKMFLNWKE